MKKIILLDEIKSLVDKKAGVLGREGFQLIGASTNKEALNLHCAEDVDLIITKLDSPDMDAVKLCSIIRENESLRDVSIIVVSPEDDEHAARKALCRANEFLTAPLDPAELDEKLHNLINVPTRAAFRAPISVKVQGRFRDEPFLCFSDNISSSGMLIETERPMSKNYVIRCTFLLPNSVRIDTDGEVARIAEKETEYDSNRYGIRFTNITDRARDAIDDFVSKE